MFKNIFNSIRVQAPKTNTFDLTHDVKFSSRMGQLTPVLCTEVVPGDRFNIGADTLIRFAPLIAPVMHRFDVTIHYFFVPNRILWEQFPDWITRNQQITAPYIPLNSSAGYTPTEAQKRFLDYMGLPPTTKAHNINALPFAAYQCIYNEYYRDQNLQNEVDYKLPSDVVSEAAMDELFTLRNRAWQHDYFTSSLPFAQKGEDVEIPMGDVFLKEAWLDGTLQDESTPNFTRATDEGGKIISSPIRTGSLGQITDDIDQFDSAYDPDGTLAVQSSTINNFRRALKLQEWLEKNARGGTRYIESILSHFGVRSSDKRLQRPEYITGVKTPIVISEVLNTSGQVLPDGDEGTPLPQGNMAGHAVSVGSGKSGSYYAEEHGFILGIMSVMPKPAYMQMLPKQFSRLDPLDYYWPSFAHIGEQEVLNKEIYIDSNTPNDTFGYVPRYAEYKYIPARVAGDFRTTLDYWHLARKFDSQPTLNSQFIQCNPDDLTRIFAVETGDDELFCHVLHKITARRPMPVYGTPML